MEDGIKKRRLGKGLSELLGEARGQSLQQEQQNATEETQAEETHLEETNLDENSDEMFHVEHSDEQLHSYTTKETEKNRAYMMVPIEYIEPNHEQPRKDFDEDDLKHLAESVQEFGIIQPLTVIKRENEGHYTLVAGERRWRAAQIAGLKEVPVILKHYDELQIMEVGLIENIQRSDLNILEEAMGYDVLLNKFELTQNEIATKMGKSRSHIANMLRVLNLPPYIKQALREKQISFGHAKLLLGLSEEEISAIGKEVLKKQLTVRELEKRIEQLRKDKPNSTKGNDYKDQDTLALEADLAAALGIDVNIKPNANKKTGQIILSYNTLEQLDEICKRLCQAIEHF